MRAITALAGESCEYRDRHWQSKRKLSSEQYEKGVKLLKLASIIQYTLPGVPSLYYGDEAGMEGYKDPFNRFCYPWGRENEELLALTFSDACVSWDISEEDVELCDCGEEANVRVLYNGEAGEAELFVNCRKAAVIPCGKGELKSVSFA
jgi:glycosidase